MSLIDICVPITAAVNIEDSGPSVLSHHTSLETERVGEEKSAHLEPHGTNRITMQ